MMLIAFFFTSSLPSVYSILALLHRQVTTCNVDISKLLSCKRVTILNVFID